MEAKVILKMAAESLMNTKFIPKPNAPFNIPINNPEANAEAMLSGKPNSVNPYTTNPDSKGQSTKNISKDMKLNNSDN